MKTSIIIGLAALEFAGGSSATEYFVGPSGNDSNPGTKKAPLRTIQHGAELAQPGDVITVGAGVYRERINPPRGGCSDRKRIIYRAAPEERVEIKGSEVVKNWTRVQENVWTVTLPNSFFGGFNPYSDLIRGDWFEPKGRQHHTGAVYLNGQWLVEAAKLDEVLAPQSKVTERLSGDPNECGLWFARVGQTNTTIWAQFRNVDPNEQKVEINVRRTVFYPDQPGRNYITVRGFALRQAATPWAPPTAEQIGLIGTHWSKDWIIESNIISHSICSGIALGKYGDEWDNTSANTAEGYVKTIERALRNGWNSQSVGHHIVRNNTISDCEQAGIVGSLGAAFSTVSGNTIHDIHVRHLFTGAEMAGIKFHAAIDTVIQNNHIYRTCRGLWLDWMAQGTRVSGNLFHDNAEQDLFVEVDHGPFVVDNNLFLSPVNLLDMSEGGAYAHNLFTGKIVSRPELSRRTPFHPAHTTTVAGLVQIKGGDDRFYNNLIIGPETSGSARRTNRANPLPARREGSAAARPASASAESEPELKDPEWAGGFGLWVYDLREQRLQTGGNVFYNGARPYRYESLPTIASDNGQKPKLAQDGDCIRLSLSLGPDFKDAATTLVTTALLGRASIPQLPYQGPDGSPIKIDTDYFGKPRHRTRPTAGPFENLAQGEVVLRLR